MSRSLRIEPAETPEDLAAVRVLLKMYWKSFGFTPCFQNFSAELAGLPGAYAPPRGRLAMAWLDGPSGSLSEPAGCIALRPADECRGEAKRLFVRPEFRGLGIGRALVEWLIGEARGAGYTELIGDSLPVMGEALALYDRIGFERTSVADGTIYLRLQLEGVPQGE